MQNFEYRGRYERTDLIKTRYKISMTQNRIQKRTGQIEEDHRILQDLQALERELATQEGK